MTRILTFAAFLVVLILGVSSASLAQKSKPKSKPLTEVLLAPPKTSADCKPINELAVVTIAENGEMSLGAKMVEKTSLRAELFNYICNKPPDEQILYIKAGTETSFNQVVEIIRLAREFEIDDVVLMPGADAATGKLKIPCCLEPDSSNKKVKAPPRALVVALAADGKIELNAKAETPKTLAARLKQTFETRKQKRIFMQGSREIEKSVFVYARTGTKFGEVVKLIHAIESTGAYPIGLDVDDYYLKMIF